VIKAFPPDLRYENALIVADGDYVIAHGRFSSAALPAKSIAADIVRMEGGPCSATPSQPGPETVPATMKLSTHVSVLSRPCRETIFDVSAFTTTGGKERKDLPREDL
jgi:hypothetical protein